MFESLHAWLSAAPSVPKTRPGGPRDLPIYFMRVEIKIISGAKDFQDCVRQICFRY